MIKVDSLYKKYQENAPYVLEDISFSIGQGEIVGLIGKNGAGKSTLMKTMCKFLRPSQGSIYLGGEDIFSKDEALIDLGIHLEPVFYPYMSAYDNMAFYLKVHKKEEYMDQIEENLRLVELENNIHDKPGSFSFGMKQRLGLAMALLGDPKFLILDEPFVGLDPNGINRLISSLKDRVREKNISALISSHQLYELSSITNRVLVIANSKIVFDGNYDENNEIIIVLDRPVSDDLKAPDLNIQGSKIITDYSGGRLNDLLKTLVKDYKILKIEPSKSKLEKFFLEV